MARQSTEHDQSIYDEPTGWRVRLRALWRLVVVGWAFLPLVLSWWRDRRRFLVVGGRREVTAEQRRARAETLLETLLSLGPTFIKLGQMLSTRPDILPSEYVDVLARLQDRVPADPWTEVEPLITAELGDVQTVFDEFDRDPISGASLGQVYTATLDGERVAVKVLRPGIRKRVEADLQVLSVLLPTLVRFAPAAQAFTLENLAEEFAAAIRREMDYGLEARTLDAIAANFADDPTIRLPAVAHDFSTDRVLTMEYVDGTKISDVAALERQGIDPKAVVERLQQAYIQMVVEDGLFHADPHPGNLAVQSDGTVVFYDFGMAGEIDAETRTQLFEFYVALAEDDVDRVMDAFIAMGALDPAADRRVMRQVFELAIDNFRGEDIEQYQIAEIVDEFQGTIHEVPMRLPQNLALIVRVTSVLEGVCRTLDPDFDFITVIREYVAGRSVEAVTGDRVREELTTRLTAFERGLRRAPTQLDDALTRAERSDLRVSMALRSSDGVFRRLGWQLLLGAATSAAALSTAGLYAAGSDVVWLPALATLSLGLLTRRSFRRRGPRRDVQVGTQMAERSIQQRKRQRAEDDGQSV